MITQLFKSKSTQRKHLDAPLLQVRIRFLSMKSEQGLCQEHLKDWARLLLAFVSCYNLQDGSTTRISLNEVVSKAELWAKSISKKSRKEKTHQMVLDEEKFVVRTIDFLEYIGLLDIRYYDNVVNLLVERKFDKVKLIVAPFFQERVSFLNEYRLSGHKKETLRRYAQYQIHLIEFLGLKNAQMVTDEEIFAAAKKWKNYSDPSSHKKSGSKWNDTFFVTVAKKWLTAMNMYKMEETKSISDIRIEKYLQDLQYRGYSYATLTSSLHSLHCFYDTIGKQNTEEPITLADIDKFLEMYTSCHSNRQTNKAYMARIRSYLHYAAEQGWCQPGVYEAVVLPRIYKEENLPSFMSWNMVQTILQRMKNTKGKSARRNYAIVLLLATYGLRCSEVANLKISDIDWRKEHIHIQHAKGGKSQTFPLLHSVGEAIIEYLRYERRNDSHNDSLFFCAKAPFRAITCHAIQDIVRRELYDVSIKHKGPHSLRHSHATFLINNGQTMKEVGDLLGHKSIDSTSIYAKVDFQSLREVSNINFDGVL